jgi:hypothetical protein
MSVRRIILEPSLRKCIETVARERYWALVDEYARTIGAEGISHDMEIEIEALRAFLEEVDIGEYRRRTEELMEKGEKVFLVLEITEEGALNVLVDHEKGRKL